jgi:GAF domain-containing protein/HAMP domain-containing protein
MQQLELAVLVKEARINAWVDSIEGTLADALRQKSAETSLRDVLQAAPDTARATDAYAALAQSLTEHAARLGPHSEMFLLDLEGATILSSVGTTGRLYGEQFFFQRGLAGPYTEATFCTELLPPQVISVRPVLSEQGDVLGVLGCRVDTSVLRGITLERTGLGNTGESYMVGPGSVACTDLLMAESGILVKSLGAQKAIEERAAGSLAYDNYAGKPVVGAYRWLPRLGVALLAEQEQREAFAAIYTMLAINGSAVLISILIAVATSLSVTREITAPLTELSSIAAEIADGEWAAVAAVRSDDEIGVLARAFNTMTAQLRQLIGQLEHTVAERTRDLERRSAYLRAAREVGRAATSVMGEDQLAGQLVELIRERFALYYVGLFTLDERNEWLVLRAATGRIGRELVAKGHRIRMGEGIVGWSVAHAQARTTSQADRGMGVLAAGNPSESRSEAALPLRSRGRAIGVLTLHSDRPDAFDQEAVAVLQIVADQVAVALDNARLFAESAQTVEAARRAYRDLSRAEWARWLYARPDTAFRGDERGVVRLSQAWSPEAKSVLEEGQTVQVTDEENRSRLVAPIRVRGSVVGVLETHKPASEGPWSAQEVALLERMLEQLELALDNARLYEDAQRLAIREQQLRQIGARMQSSFSVEDVLQVAVEELAKALNVPLAFVQLTPDALRTPRE